MNDSFERELAEGIRRVSSETDIWDARVRVRQNLERSAGGTPRSSRSRGVAGPILVAAAVAALVVVPFLLSQRDSRTPEASPADGPTGTADALATMTHEQACPVDAPVKQFPASLDQIDVVYRCIDMVEQERWSVLRVTSGLEELAKAYRGPDVPRVKGEACAFNAPDRKRLWVHQGAQVFAVYAPHDGCGNATEPAVRAYEELVGQELGAGNR